MTKILLFILMLIFSVGAKESISIAVSDFEGRKIGHDDVLSITDKIRDEMQKHDLFKVMDRSEMGIIMQEMEFQQSGACNDAACAVEVGQILGVEYIVTGSIGQVGSIWYITLKMINVSSSEVAYSISKEYEGKIEDLLTKHASTTVNALVEMINDKNMGKIVVTSSEKETEVSFNDAVVGNTPFESSFLSAGNYVLTLSKPTFTTIIDTVSVTAGKTTSKEYTLVHTKAFTDSLFNADQKAKKKKQWARRIIFGTLGATCAVLGYKFNSDAEEADANKVDAVAKNKSAGATDDFAALQSDVAKYEDEYNSSVTKRNVMYGAAGAFGLAFILSIPF